MKASLVWMIIPSAAVIAVTALSPADAWARRASADHFASLLT